MSYNMVTSSMNSDAQGVSEGSILGRLLFIVGVNDLTINIDKPSIYLYGDSQVCIPYYELNYYLDT